MTGAGVPEPRMAGTGAGAGSLPKPAGVLLLPHSSRLCNDGESAKNPQAWFQVRKVDSEKLQQILKLSPGSGVGDVFNDGTGSAAPRADARASSSSRSWNPLPSLQTLRTLTAWNCAYIPGAAAIITGASTIATPFISDATQAQFAPYLASLPQVLTDALASASVTPDLLVNTEATILAGLKEAVTHLSINPADNLLPPASKIVLGLSLLLLGRAIQSTNLQSIKHATTTVINLLLRTVQYLGYSTGACALLGSAVSAFNQIVTTPVAGQDIQLPEWLAQRPKELTTTLIQHLNTLGLETQPYVDEAVNLVTEHTEVSQDNAGPATAALAGILLIVVAALAQQARKLTA